MAFIVYDNDTETIYGTGNTVREAAQDAVRWADLPEGTVIDPVHGVAHAVGAEWRWLAATPSLIERVAAVGGDVRWLIGHANCADLAD